MYTLDMTYAKQSLYYQPDSGWHMYRSFFWDGAYFWNGIRWTLPMQEEYGGQ